MGNQQSLKVGSIELKTLFPEVAAEADGGIQQPLTLEHTRRNPGSALKVKWVASAKDRTGEVKICCPFCAEHGFNRDKDAWIYLMERPGEQQIGITNDLETRIKTH